MSPVGTLRAATTLALWAAAWQGGASADDVLSAIDDSGHRAGVRAASADIADATGLPGPGWPSAGSAALLPLLREGGAAQLLLPYPGDLRGLPVGGELTVAALDAGAVVVLPVSSIALVPSDGQWRAFHCPTRHPALGLGEAHEMLDHAVGRATRSLTALDVARGSDSAREQVRRTMLAEAVSCPPGTPPPASALLATSISLHSLLAVASSQDTAAVTSYEMAAVDDVLRPLAIAIRESPARGGRRRGRGAQRVEGRFRLGERRTSGQSRQAGLQIPPVARRSRSSLNPPWRRRVKVRSPHTISSGHPPQVHRRRFPGR